MNNDASKSPFPGPGWRVVLLLLVAACTESPMFPSPRPSTPPGYEQMEPAVQSQFEALMDAWSALAADEHRADADLGAAWGALGQWFQVYRYPSSALQAYTEAARLDADNPRWSYFQAVLLMEDGRLDEAESAFRRSIESADAELAPSAALADLLLQRLRTDEAVELYEQILTRDPMHLASRVALARLALEDGDPERAVGRLQAIAEDAGPYQRDVDYLLGQAFRRLGQPEQARTHLERFQNSARRPGATVRDNPWMRELGAIDISANTLSRLGQAAYLQGRFLDAARHTGRAARYNPDDPEILANYASVLMALRRFEDARVQIERALALDPELGRALMIHGKLLLEFGERDAAEAALANALRIDPDLKDARRMLGRSLHQRGELAAAIEQYAELRQRFRSLDQARFWHAALLAADGRTDDALAALEDDLAIHPESRELRLLAARLSTQVGVPSSSMAQSLLPSPSELDAASESLFELESYAMLAAAQGRFAEAVDYQERAVQVAEDAGARSVRQLSNQIARRRLALYREGRPCLTPWESREILMVAETSPWVADAGGS